MLAALMRNKYNLGILVSSQMFLSISLHSCRLELASIHHAGGQPHPAAGGATDPEIEAQFAKHQSASATQQFLSKQSMPEHQIASLQKPAQKAQSSLANGLKQGSAQSAGFGNQKISIPDAMPVVATSGLHQNGMVMQEQPQLQLTSGGQKRKRGAALASLHCRVPQDATSVVASPGLHQHDVVKQEQQKPAAAASEGRKRSKQKQQQQDGVTKPALQDHVDQLHMQQHVENVPSPKSERAGGGRAQKKHRRSSLHAGESFADLSSTATGLPMAGPVSFHTSTGNGAKSHGNGTLQPGASQSVNPEPQHAPGRTSFTMAGATSKKLARLQRLESEHAAAEHAEQLGKRDAQQGSRDVPEPISMPISKHFKAFRDQGPASGDLATQQHSSEIPARACAAMDPMPSSSQLIHKKDDADKLFSLKHRRRKMKQQHGVVKSSQPEHGQQQYTLNAAGMPEGSREGCPSQQLSHHPDPAIITKQLHPPTQAASHEQPAAVMHSTSRRKEGSGLLEQMRAKLSGGHFRWLNEQLYTTTGDAALEFMTQNPSHFNEYHKVNDFGSLTFIWSSCLFSNNRRTN